MKFFFKAIIIFIVTLGGLTAPLVTASETIIISNTKTEMPNKAVNSERFEQKGAAERRALPANERVVVEEIEKYLNDADVTIPKSRSVSSAVEKVIAGLAFDVAVRRNNSVISVTDFFGLTSGVKENKWFEGLKNKSDRYQTVFDKPTNKNIKLHAYYIDNKSAKTALVQHGYRSQPINIMAEAKLLSDLGYNVIVPDARSHGKSQGEYIAFGAYEKNDVNGWLEQEAAIKPNQEFVLLGVSMGAATVMMSQDTINPNLNVKAIIEDCGYFSIEEQAHDVMHMVTKYLQYIPLVNMVDWYAFENRLVDSLNDNYVKPKLKIDLYDISPLNSVENSTVPKLFIHGTKDTFIPPKAKTVLYGAAAGYKEQLDVVGAGHAENLEVSGQTYIAKVTVFLQTVDNISTLRAEIAPTINLLKNSALVTSQTGIPNWLMSSDKKNYRSNVDSKIKISKEQLFTLDANKDSQITKMTNGSLRMFLFKQDIGAFLKQDLAGVAGENYLLTFDSLNPNTAEFNTQTMSFGLGDQSKNKNPTTKGTVKQTMSYTAKQTGMMPIYFGTHYTKFNFLGSGYVQIYFSNLKVINTDIIPPRPVTIDSVINQSNQTIITGEGERNTVVKLVNEDKKIVSEVTTTAEGEFSITLPKQTAGTIMHLVNQDVKGNRSESKVIVAVE